MAYGILAKPLRPIAGLGVVSTVAGECWDQAGFKDCYGQMWKTAAIECRLQGKDNDDCIVPRTDQLVKLGCKCTKKPTVTTPVFSSSSKVEPLEPASPKFFGLSLNTILLVGAGVAAVYVMAGDDSKKKAKG